MNRLISVVALSFLIACGGKGTSDDTTTAAGNPCAADPCAADPCAADPCAADPCAADPCAAAAAAKAPSSETGVDWSGWQSWTKLSSAPFKSKHGGVMVDVYVPAEHSESYKAMSGPMPKGMGIVKAQYKKDDPSTLDKLTVMAKMAPGYDPDNGDWYYAVLSPDGKNAMMEGKVETCQNCHTGGKNDFLFGVAK